ncbi:MAG: ATP-binding protein [Planctomycetota bacterium]|jgi:anti-sigma regulatory factor (Ser/Thr protein kinase)
MMTQEIKNTLVARKTTESLDEIREFAYAITEAAGFSEQEKRLIVHAIETAATGIILNAREQNIEGGLAIKVDVDESRLRVEIDDAGDIPLAGPPAGTREFVRSLPRHSLGIFLIRRIMHEVEYEYRRGFISRLTMVRFRD